MDVIEAYSNLLNSGNDHLLRSASRCWCMWKSSTPDWPPTHKMQKRFEDPVYAVAFSRIVTHYVKNNAWLKDGILLEENDYLAGIDGILINGRYDFLSPLWNA